AAPVPGARAREGEGGAAVVRARPQPHAKPRSATRLTRHPISEAASFARRRVGRGGEQAADRRPGIASSPPAGVRIPPSPAIRTVASQSLTPTYSVESAAGPENFSAPRAERAAEEAVLLRLDESVLVGQRDPPRGGLRARCPR